MQINEIVETLKDDFLFSNQHEFKDMPIFRCQLLFEMPTIITPQTLYIQAEPFYLDPTDYHDSFFFMLAQVNHERNAVSFAKGTPLDVYQAVSTLLIDNETYVQAVAGLQRVAITNGGIKGLIEEAYLSLQNPIHILDRFFSLIDCFPKTPCGNEIFDYFLVHQKPEQDYLKHVESIIMKFSANHIRCAQIVDYNKERSKLITCSIGALPHLLGGIEVLELNRPFTQTDVKIVDVLILFLQIELYKGNSVIEKMDTQFEQFIYDILQGLPHNQDLLKQRLKYFPHLENRDLCLLLCQIPKSKTCTLKYYHEEIVHSIPMLESFRYQNDLYFLIDMKQIESKQIAKLNKIAKKNNTLMVLSDSFDCIIACSTIVTLLKSALPLIESNEGLFQFKELYFKTLLHVASSSSSIPLSYFIHPGISLLKEHDQFHQTDFLSTFKLYLQCQCSPSVTAATLHLHRNSLIYRIQKARQISRFVSEDMIDCQNFLMSIQIDEYLNH